MNCKVLRVPLKFIDRINLGGFINKPIEVQQKAIFLGHQPEGEGPS
jgi:hypothetical protein